MVDHARDVSWADGERIDVSDAMMRLTLRIVCKTLFDHDVVGQTDTIAATMDALRRGSAQSLLPDWVPTPGRIRTRRAVRVARVDTELGGYALPAGSQVVSWVWHCHRGRSFEDADAFRPERFLDPAFPKHAYLPFGSGSRMCIGAGFARMELRLLLASLARRYRLRAAPGQQVEPLPRVTLSPTGGLPLRVERRPTSGPPSPS